MNHSTAPPAADGYVPDVQVVQGDEPFASEAENAVKHGATTRHATAAHRSACTASSSSRSSLCDDGRSVPGRASGSRARVARRDGRGRLPSGHRNSWGTEYSLPDQGARTPPPYDHAANSRAKDRSESVCRKRRDNELQPLL